MAEPPGRSHGRTQEHPKLSHWRSQCGSKVTLYYHKGSFCSWPWTYPDYASEPYLALFNRIRDAYLAQLRQPIDPGQIQDAH